MVTFSTVSREPRVRFSYKPQNGVFSLFGKISNCEFEEQGSIPENTQKYSGKITVVVYSPWTREVASSNLASQT